ncbi:hypothetical protein [Butyrivibrio sp. AE3004]|uniref:hypothetical protein n=1 Tax=Butyrivibrio sp. AE3004 TaxID=1506994 RepID=UPI000494BFA5|nr:hypothetical protein [Butyrivibrio sp. AE3004]
MGEIDFIIDENESNLKACGDKLYMNRTLTIDRNKENYNSDCFYGFCEVSYNRFEKRTKGEIVKENYYDIRRSKEET